MNNRLDFFGGYAVFGNGLLEIYSEPPTDLVAPAVGGILKFAQSLQGTPGQKQLPSEGTTKTLRLASIASVTISFRAQNSALVNSIGKFALPIFGKADSNSGDMEVIGTIDISTTLGGSGAAHPVARIGGKNISNFPTDGVEIPISKNRREEAIRFFEELKTAIGTAGTPSQGGEDTAAKGKTKKCPDCAEEVKFEARKCRYCGFVFGDAVTNKIKSNDSSPSIIGIEPNDSLDVPDSSQPSDSKPLEKFSSENKNQEPQISQEVVSKNKTQNPKSNKSRFWFFLIILVAIVVGLVVVFIQGVLPNTNYSLSDSSANQTKDAADESAETVSPKEELLQYIDATAAKISADGVTESWYMGGDPIPSIFVYDPTHEFNGLRYASAYGNEQSYTDDASSYLQESTYSTQGILENNFPWFFDVKNYGITATTAQVIKIDNSTFSLNFLLGENREIWIFKIANNLITTISTESIDPKLADYNGEMTYLFGHNPLGDGMLKGAETVYGED